MKKFIPKNIHLGDLWATVSYVISHYDDYEFILDPTCKKEKIEWFKTIINYFQTDTPIKISIEEFNKDIHTKKMFSNLKDSYRHHYVKSKILWDEKNVKNIICYNLKSKFERDNKTPPWLKEFENELENCENAIDITYPMSFDEVFNNLSTCKAFISVDSGLAHIARSVNCPMFIIEHLYSLDRAFPYEYASYIKIKTIKDARMLLL